MSLTKKPATTLLSFMSNKSNIQIVNLSSYSAPSIIESKRRDWVEYGEDNNYFQYLIDRFNGSPTNNAIINGMIELIHGRGLDATDSDRKPESYAQMKALFKKQEVRRIVSDFKLMGQAAIQVIYSKDRTKVAAIYHMPVETLRAEKCNDDGDVEAYYYHKDWTSASGRNKPQRIPAFGFSNDPIEILYIKPYRAGFYYYAPTDYQGGIAYAELEEEIANYHLNNVRSGLTPSMLINFNNGVPNDEEQRIIEQRITDKFGGTSNAGKFILAFNDSSETQASIEPVALSDASNQYQFLSDESMRKLMVAHRVTSPMLLGIKDQSGLGNNADELKTASQLFDNMVIRPIQDVLLEAFDRILEFNDISLDLYFKTLQPIEFAEAVAPMDAATLEQETGVKLSDQKRHACSSKCQMNSDQSVNSDYLDELEKRLRAVGETIDSEEFELIEEVPVNDPDREDQILSMYNFAAASGQLEALADPEEKDQQDVALFKIRYSYAPLVTGTQKSRSRDFCERMVGLAKEGLVFRSEDIQAMKDIPVNAGFGPDGAATYDIWKYKGGAWCQHYWTRKIYRRKRDSQGRILPNDGLLNDVQVSVNEARKAGVPIPTNDPKVAMRPRDMENNGFKS